jgi:acetyltransferase-like isoleucine patch superfamily enzyme
MSVFIHRSAEVSKDATIGDGTKIWNEVQVREKARIGRNCRLGKSVYIDTNVVIGDNCKIQNLATLYDGLTVGDDVFIGPHVCFTNDLYPRAVSPDWRIVATKVKDGASIGANATILCGVTIGKNAMVGAGSVVIDDVPDHALFIGNPARLIGFVCTCGRTLDKSFWCSHCRKKVVIKAPARKRRK